MYSGFKLKERLAVCNKVQHHRQRPSLPELCFIDPELSTGPQEDVGPPWSPRVPPEKCHPYLVLAPGSTVLQVRRPVLVVNPSL